MLLPVGETTRVALRGNLDANAPPGTTVHTFVEVFDSERQVHRLGLVFTRQRTPHTWELRGYLSARSGRMLDDQIVNIVFGVDGALVAIGDPEAAMTFQINGLSVPQTVRFHLGTPGQFDGLTQLPDPGLPPRQAPLLALRASDDGRTLAEQHPELASRLQLLLTASHFSSDQSAAGNPLASLACSGIIRSR
ncbi:MAG: hypothetical protein JNM56_33540 [Planctomycetia bacterium]|nr:hypothetical protein [Planctomycetia bacterium]